MREKRTVITVKEAVRRVMQHTYVGSKETIPLEEAYGRYLAEDLRANQDVPAFDRSPYDGFAIRAEDTEKGPSMFEVIGEIRAGTVFNREVGAYQAVRIMTGAQIPTGCDVVVMVELVKEFEDNDKTHIHIKRSFKKGDNIAYQGEDTKKGMILAKKGTYINPGIVALLATFGFSEIAVTQKPVVGILAIGTDLLDVNEPLEQGKIRDSNTAMLLSQIQRLGGSVKYFGRIKGEYTLYVKTIKEALSQVDLLITTGGASVGDHDYLPAIYEQLGATVLFNKVAMRPGSITTVAHVDGKLLFGLSGNPSACYVGFELFVRPVINTYMDNPKPHMKKEKAILNANVLKANPFLRFVRAKLVTKDEKRFISPCGLDKSSSVASLAQTNAFIVFPGGTQGYRKGMLVDVLLLEEKVGSEWPWNDLFPSYK